MLTRFRVLNSSFGVPRVLACNAFLLVLVTLLFSTPSPAQTNAEKPITPQQLIDEARKFAQQGTKDSYQKAIEKFEQARVLSRTTGDRRTEARATGNIGLMYSWMGEKERALEYYTQALPIAREIKDVRTEAFFLTKIGLVYYSRGETSKALKHHEQALPLTRTAGDRLLEAEVLHNIALAQDILGEKRKALGFHIQAKEIAREVGDRNGEAVTLGSIANMHAELGEPEKALDSFTQALALFRALKDRGGEAGTLNNLANLYLGLGKPQEAVDYFQQALALYLAIEDQWNAAEVMGNIANAFSDLGNKSSALDYYVKALAVHRQLGNRPSEASALSNIGRIYSITGPVEKAIDYNKQALEIQRAVGNRRNEAYTLSNLAGDYERLGRREEALDLYKQSLTLKIATEDRGGQATTLHAIAVLERNRGNLKEAKKQIEDALAIVESLRARIANEQLRSSYYATVQGIHEFYIDLLMRMHKENASAGLDAEALTASERARARALLETLAEAKADIRQGVDPQLLDRERALQKQLNDKAQEQMQILGAAHTQEQARTITRQVETLTAELQQAESRIKQNSPRYAALTQPRPLSLKEIQTQVLDADTLLLEYSLGEERSYLWAVTSTSITSYELPKRDEIENSARELYGLLTDANQRSSELADLRSGNNQTKKTQSKGGQVPLRSTTAATRLANMVLAPAAAQLKKKRLLIVADGALQYIPFGALPTPTLASVEKNYHPLILEHEIVTLPSASTLAVLRQETKDRTAAPEILAVFADPVFEREDHRVKHANRTSESADKTQSPGSELPVSLQRAMNDTGVRDDRRKIPRLPGTREEARQILALVPAGNSKQALDFNASRQTAISGELSKYRYVHFATHGFLDSLHPELSGIVLSMVDEDGKSQDGFLRAHEVFNLKLPADLVVLSACQTGLGKEVRGEGLVGLTRGFMYAGAPRVVVSLWNVNDQATAELMGRFYRGMLKDKLRPAAALRAAQVSLMKEKKWQSPFYWAAFTLQGEWR